MIYRERMTKNRLQQNLLGYTKRLNATENAATKHRLKYKIALFKKQIKAIEEKDKVIIAAVKAAKDVFDLDIRKILTQDFRQDYLSTAYLVRGFFFKYVTDKGIQSGEVERYFYKIYFDDTINDKMHKDRDRIQQSFKDDKYIRHLYEKFKQSATNTLTLKQAVIQR